ncbi:Defensin-like protein 19 [Glycine max]|nr:Defensin-like protein 19 [Glycine max]
MMLAKARVVEAKICEKYSKTWSGWCGNSNHCDNQCKKWEGAKFGSCHWDLGGRLVSATSTVQVYVLSAARHGLVGVAAPTTVASNAGLRKVQFIELVTLTFGLVSCDCYVIALNDIETLCNCLKTHMAKNN